MQSHETYPRKTATVVTCGDCRCGPLDAQGKTHGSSMGWFNYTRKQCVSVCRHDLLLFSGWNVCVAHNNRDFLETTYYFSLHVPYDFQAACWNNEWWGTTERITRIKDGMEEEANWRLVRDWILVCVCWGEASGQCFPGGWGPPDETTIGFDSLLSFTSYAPSASLQLCGSVELWVWEERLLFSPQSI